MTETVTTDGSISRCPDCGAWRYWYRCFTCIPSARHDEKAA